MADSRSIGPEEALEQANALVAASTADETEVTLESEQDRFVRFAERGPTQCADRERLRVAVRVRERVPGGGYREARAEAVGPDPASWRRALDAARRLAHESPVDEEAPPLGGPVSVARASADAGTLAHPFETKARWVDLALSACAQHDLRPAGLARTTGLLRAIASSTGRAVVGETSRASLSLTATGASGSGIGVATRHAVDALDAETVVRRAVTRAAAAQEPRPVDAGEYPVLLEPLAVSSLLLFASYRGFGAREVEEGDSFLCGRIGERVLAPELSVVDDPACRLAPGLGFDGEGSPVVPTPLVEGGVLRGPVTDSRYARKLGVACTGHARPQPSPSGPGAEHLVVAPGTRSFDELLADLGTGLLVSQFHYTNVIDPHELLLTGMTRNGTFLVQDGEIRHAVRNLRFTDSLVRALGAVLGVGASQEVAGALFDGQVVTPSLALPALRFTSTTDF